VDPPARVGVDPGNAKALDLTGLRADVAIHAASAGGADGTPAKPVRLNIGTASSA
jgi:hypothetical protein